MQVGKEIEVGTDFNKCYCCGKDNPIGLKLSFRREGDQVVSEFVGSEYHQGWPGLVHGGVIATVMDDAMSYACYFEGLACVTGKMEVRFRKPLQVGSVVMVRANIHRKNRKLVEGKASLTGDGTLVAEGTALMYVVEDQGVQRSNNGTDAGLSQA